MSEKIAGDDFQKADARHEADTLSDSMGTLEFNLMLEMWNNVLKRFNLCSKKIQAADIDLHTAVALLESLKAFITGVRDKFDEYEANAKTRTDVDYMFEKRAKRRRLGAHRLPIPSEVISGAENFKRNTFLPILDQLHVALTDRVNAYTILHQRFSFLLTLDKVDDLQQKCETLCHAYPDDLPQGKELYLEVLLPCPKKDFSHWGSCVLKVRFCGALTSMTLLGTSATRSVVNSLCYNYTVSS